MVALADSLPATGRVPSAAAVGATAIDAAAPAATNSGAKYLGLSDMAFLLDGEAPVACVLRISPKATPALARAGDSAVNSPTARTPPPVSHVGAERHWRIPENRYIVINPDIHLDRVCAREASADLLAAADEMEELADRLGITHQTATKDILAMAVSLPAPPWPSGGFEGLVPHGLRHTRASPAIGAGANVKVVQRMLGHATAAMILDLNGHLLDDDLTGVADGLGKASRARRYHCCMAERNPPRASC
jgi:hypothetical protein